MSGPLVVVGPSSSVSGATEVNYVMATRKQTSFAPPIVDGLNGASCGGKKDWASGVEGDTTTTGCPAFGIEANPPCDKEMDLNKRVGDQLRFGDRSKSLCSARPTALAALPVIKP